MYNRESPVQAAFFPNHKALPLCEVFPRTEKSSGARLSVLMTWPKLTGTAARVFEWNLCSLWERQSQQLPATTCRHKSGFQFWLAPSKTERFCLFEFCSSVVPLPDHTETKREAAQHGWESLLLSRASSECSFFWMMSCFPCW